MATSHNRAAAGAPSGPAHAREQCFNPDPVAIARLEDRAAITQVKHALKAGFERSGISNGIKSTLGRHRIAFGSRQTTIAATFCRLQAERLHRLLKLRGQFLPDKHEQPNEPRNEPIPAPQPAENTVAPISDPISKSANEPILQRIPPTRQIKDVLGRTCFQLFQASATLRFGRRQNNPPPASFLTGPGDFQSPCYTLSR